MHSIWEQGQLHLWIEMPSFIRIKHNQLQSNDSPVNIIDKHPYSANFTTIINILQESQSKLTPVKKASKNELIISLLSNDKEPLPTNINFYEVLEPISDYKLKKWQVDTLSLNPYEALNFLLDIDSNNFQNIKFSDSILFWKKVTLLALELIENKSFLPTIKNIKSNSDKTLFFGFWSSYIQGNDIRLLEIIRELTENSQHYIQSDDLKETVINFLDTIIDSYIRNKLGVFLPKSQFDEKQENTKEIAKKWFESLFDPEPSLIECSTDDFTIFLGSLKSWLNNVLPKIQNNHFITCFKLMSPDDDSYPRNWSLAYYLQAENDSSLLLPANDIWQIQMGTITLLEEKYENPQERLLADLALASITYPKIEVSLEQSFPSNIQLTTDEVYQFLEKYAKSLEEQGFRILLPTWMTDPAKIRLKMRLLDNNSPKITQGLFRMNSFLDFEWEIAIKDTRLSPNEFEQLANLRVPFVNVRGQWLNIDVNELDQAIEILRDKNRKISVNEIIQQSLIQEENLSDEPFDLEYDNNSLFQDSSFNLSSLDDFQIEPTPLGFNGTLRPYQVEGFSWLKYLKKAGFGACLGDDMGLGKTIQLIALLLNDYSERNIEKSPSIIICPTSIIGNWFREISKFAPSLSVFIHHGNNRLKGLDFTSEVSNYDVIITTYNLAYRDIKTLSEIFWENVILDEAQNIKNPRSKQTRTIKSLNSNYRIALTGTPVENRLSELWSIFDFINPGYLGNINKFTQKYILPIEKDNNKDKIQQLSSIIKPFILRRLKTDPNIINDLPDKNEYNIYCSLTEEQAILYEAVVKDLFNKLNDCSYMQRKGLVLATITKLKQICNHPALFMHEKREKLANRSCKFNRLIEILDEVLSTNEKILIFTQYKELGELLQDFLQKKLNTKVLFLSGDTKTKQRETLIAEFQRKDVTSPKIFILSIKAGGVGLNLTAATHVLHFDRWWNPAVENQATDRAYRIGQKRNVMVHKFVCIGTLEESIDQLIEQKKNLADAIITTGDNWLTELTNEDLNEVLTLRKVL